MEFHLKTEEQAGKGKVDQELYCITNFILWTQNTQNTLTWDHPPPLKGTLSQYFKLNNLQIQCLFFVWRYISFKLFFLKVHFVNIFQNKLFSSSMKLHPNMKVLTATLLIYSQPSIGCFLVPMDTKRKVPKYNCLWCLRATGSCTVLYCTEAVSGLL